MDLSIKNGSLYLSQKILIPGLIFCIARIHSINLTMKNSLLMINTQKYQTLKYYDR